MSLLLEPSATTQTIDQVVRWADLTGVLANAVLGGVLARSRRFDLVGFMVLALLSGLGGGMIRDALLQQGPAVALTDGAYLFSALAGALVAYLLPLGGHRFHRFFPYVDAIALGTWATVGAEKALGAGLDWLPAILLGTITAVGGGAVRDVVLQQTPAVLGGNTLYATSAVLAGAVLVTLRGLDVGAWAVIPAALSGVALTVLAARRGWSLPSASDQLVWIRPRIRWRRPRPRLDRRRDHR